MPTLRSAAVLLAVFISAGCGTEAAVNPCGANTCQNGGTCSVDGEGRTQCACTAGFTGLSCNIVEGVCEPNPCQNNGVCSASGNSASCACPTGFSGSTCEIVETLPTTCTPNPCKNAGTCDVVAGAVACTCKPGFSGPTCATATTACSPNPCLNGGACAEVMGDAVCTCVAPYGGENCASFIPPGDLNLSTANTFGRTCADMVSYSVIALPSSTSATLSATPGAGCLAVGDEVLLINLQGTFTHIFNTGNWDLLEIISMSGATINFKVAKQRYYGDDIATDTNLGVGATNQRVVLQRVPKYPGLEVPAGRALTAAAWNGVSGGVFALRTEGDASFEGSVNMAGKGYRGGITNSIVGTTGRSGESLRGIGPVVQNPSTGGGGGGAGNCAAGISFSGGGGGYGVAGSAGGDATCSGGGGVPYGDAALDKIFFGSGGGAGGAPTDASVSPSGGYGGAGGGIVIILAGGAVTGSIVASGQAGYGDAAECTLPNQTSTFDCWDTSGPGGGGAGGSIFSRAKSSMGTRDISGGAGGDGVSVPGRPQNGGAGAVGRASN